MTQQNNPQKAAPLEGLSLLQHVYDPATFRQQGHALIDLLADHLEAVQHQQDPTVMPYQNPEESYTYWQQELLAPLLNDPLPLFEAVIKRSVKVHHPHYLGHQVAVTAPAAALAGLVSTVLNQGMALYEMGMVSVPMERLVTELLAQKIGYDSSSNGILTSGGTLANLTALLTARSMKAPSNVWTEGHQERLAIMVSEEAHYCVDRAARIMGLGSAGIIKLPTDERFKMRTDLLEQYLTQAKSKGLHVFAIVGSCCSTSTGSHDDLVAIADFAERHNIWFHADGAHGGAAVFSQKYRHLLNGMERADSVVVDFHKVLMTPALATALVFKKGSDGFNTFQQRAQYLWNSSEADWYNPGKRTFECTKYMMSLKIFVLLRLYGEAGFAAAVERLYDLGQKFAAMISTRPDFELAMPPECNIVCFRIVKNGVADLNAYNLQCRQKLLEKGHFYIVQTTLRDVVYLRISIMNPLTTENDFVLLLDELTAIQHES
ncbi:pyridoxal phosphate-dependent decarboxylase family protein [Haliscomenobacter hydrossis]|uniref:Diaminobutyrate decarboxylase n=1 Tax=Haliscomenobacter hydrossis (strain ATCC 27775 / DSM 1100 / LMG 10767 / O) TaxID=760192 RepID=F4KV58_HALH1|nr:aminotransferase class I/II-fold pyridoxal phosphate-dependent enzyme [Haliscomenobacter hydrossis]AEE49224.1 Diaminobutyrate decarboxylase [Haliscomenobacter hydrossis DSM 1100]